MNQNTQPLTLIESAIERRNFYQGRLVEALADIIFFTRQLNESEPDSQQRVDAKASIKNKQESVANDEKVLGSFDILIAELQNQNKEAKTPAPVKPVTKPVQPTQNPVKPMQKGK